MIDYEDMILARQEAIEIWEDEPDSPYLDEWIDVIDEVINEQRKSKEAAAD